MSDVTDALHTTAAGPTDRPPPANYNRVSASFLGGRALTAYGDGLWFTIWALYLVNIREFSTSSMGFAVGIGGLLGICIAAPAGRLADRCGPTAVLITLNAVQAVAALSYLFADSVWQLALITMVYSGSESAANGVRVALVSLATDATRRAPLLAKGRALQHGMYGIGAACGALVVAIGSPAAYTVAIYVNAATFVLAAIAAATVWIRPADGDRQEARAAASLGLRNLPFIGLMSTTAILAISMAMLSTGLPLWIEQGTDAPTWISPVCVVISCAVIAAGQVRASRYTRGLAKATKVTHYSGYLLVISCLVFAISGVGNGLWFALVAIAIALVFQIAGEIAYTASRWELSLRLMDPLAQGQYQGLAATAEATALAAGPAVVALLIGSLGSIGWLALAPLFLVAVLPTAALCRLALYKRTHSERGTK